MLKPRCKLPQKLSSFWGSLQSQLLILLIRINNYLKKCYVSYLLIQANPVILTIKPNYKIKIWFNETFELIKDETNIPLEIIDRNDHEDGGMNFYIQYIGPLGGIGAQKRVKVDISRSEDLVFEPVDREVFLAYSDQEEYKLLCYRLEEILVEKLRSIIQRMQPRDFYDIWYLLEIHGIDIDFHIPEYKTKCESKGVDPLTFHSNLDKRINQYKGRWEKPMNDQIKDLPDFDTVLRELNRQFKKFE